MGRHLVVCTDGTWNTPDRRDHGLVVPSNVVKVARAIAGCDDGGVEQFVYYDTGVGTGGWWDGIKGGALGCGLSENVKQAYEALGKTFEPGDKIFLFGFSRGAYTARSLAGLIGLCGIPKGRESNVTAIAEGAFRIYRSRSRARRKAERAEQHIEKYSHVDNNGRPLKNIHFIGVWDTVGALGIPFGIFRLYNRRRFRFHDTALGDHIERAYQALAIDERRRRFKPALWQDDRASGTRVVEQLWFPGVHTNIGGGYIDHGLSDRAFLWVCLKARDAGLGFKADYMNLRVTPDYHGELRNSRVGIYRLLCVRTRAIGESDAAGEAIHYSAEERFNHATESNYREGHARRNLGPALANAGEEGWPSVAPALKEEKAFHSRLDARFWKDGGGSPASFS